MQKRKNILVRMVIGLQRWMDSVPGQTFLNYAYSWGASVVILGALFKLTHLPGGNIMLFIGMGTEVVVFFISAFDRPFDKEQIGKELPKTFVSEADAEAAAALAAAGGVAPVIAGGAPIVAGGEVPAGGEAQSGAAASAGGGGGVIVVGGGGGTAVVGGGGAGAVTGGSGVAVGGGEAVVSGGDTPAVAPTPVDTDAQQLAAIIRAANDELLQRAQAVLSPEMEEATKTYIEKLRLLAETFEKVDEQSARLTRDSEEMENLNRTLTGINKVYELHLKSISLQVGTIDEINNQTHKLSEQIQSLNQVYGRMIEALTVNMRQNAQ